MNAHLLQIPFVEDIDAGSSTRGWSKIVLPDEAPLPRP